MAKAMTKDSKMICYGLGVTDPKNIFGTTKNLEKKFGKEEFLMYQHQKMHLQVFQ